MDSEADGRAHAEATYRVIPFGDGTFAVEVSIPETYPTKVSPFATEADAEAWIAEHQGRVQSENEPSRRFRTRLPYCDASGVGREHGNHSPSRHPMSCCRQLGPHCLNQASRAPPTPANVTEKIRANPHCSRKRSRKTNTSAW